MVPGRGRSRSGDEAGSSSVTSVFGVMILLSLLFLATQVLVHLWAVSTVTAVAFDEARRVSAASSDGTLAGGCDDRVEPRVRERLGAWGRSAAVTCAPHPARPEAITVRVVGPTPARSLARIGFSPVADIDRSATLLTETPPAPRSPDPPPAHPPSDGP